MIFNFNLQRVRQRGRLAIILLAAALTLTACGKKTVATAGSEYEANLMFDILHTHGFQVEKGAASQTDVKSWEITIDEGLFGGDEAATAILVLRDYGLPRLPDPEVKTTDSLGIVSDREEKEKQRRDLQLQIERQLYTLPDVIRASVIIAQPIDDVLSLEKTPPSASISLVLKETQPKFTIESIQSLASGGVPKLKPENVKVVITQQTLREIPLEKLTAQRHSNQVFAVGGAAVALLVLTLGVILWMSRRRKHTAAPTDTDDLSGGKTDDNSDENDYPLLAGENDDD